MDAVTKGIEVVYAGDSGYGPITLTPNETMRVSLVDAANVVWGCEDAGDTHYEAWLPNDRGVKAWRLGIWQVGIDSVEIAGITMGRDYGVVRGWDGVVRTLRDHFGRYGDEVVIARVGD